MVVAKPEDAKASTEEKAEVPVEQKADVKVWKVTKQDKESGKSTAIYNSKFWLPYPFEYWY